jgi:hypothetical protein
VAPTLGRASEQSSRGRVGWRRARGAGEGGGGGASRKEEEEGSRAAIGARVFTVGRLFLYGRSEKETNGRDSLGLTI